MGITPTSKGSWKVNPLQKLAAARGMAALGHTMKTLANKRRDIETHRQWVNKRLQIQPTPQGEDSEMMVLGDVTVNQQAPEPKPQSKLPSLLKLAAGAALTATGAGAGVGLSMGIPALVELLKPVPVVSEPVAETPDTPEAEKWIGIELDK